MIKVYAYRNCGTCRKALKWLEARKVAYKEIPIREQPPTLNELETMLKMYDGDVRKLFNTSGMDYRALKLKEKLPAMSTDEALALLAGNGNLVRRPFVLTSEGEGAVGFKEEEWEEMIGEK